jgi:hydroxymethylbilane synthase
MAARHELRIGARSSPLSLAQAEEVAAPLRKRFPDLRFEVVTLSTAGDRDRKSSLVSLGRGAFVKEIEVALLEGRIDVAVHSAKDVPSDLPEGLTLAGTVPRRDPRDVLVDRWSLPLDELPPGARLGTSSPRRTAQIKARRPDIEMTPIRGNVGTRLEKARGPDYDGVVLAAAGLARLGRLDEVAEYLPIDVCTPDVGQGTLAVEVREEDRELMEMLERIDDVPTSTALRAERAFLAALRGGCTVPVAAYGRIEDGRLRITSMAAAPDGSRVYRIDRDWPPERPEEAGIRMAQALLDTGAREIV